MVLKKSTEQTKSILVAVQDLKIFWIYLFLNRLNLSIALSFIQPKVGIINLDEHKPFYVYENFLRIGMSSHFLKLVFKTLQYSPVSVLKVRISKWALSHMFLALPVLKFKKQVMSQKVFFMKFQKVETNSLISVFSKWVFKLLFCNILWPTWSK